MLHWNKESRNIASFRQIMSISLILKKILFVEMTHIGNLKNTIFHCIYQVHTEVGKTKRMKSFISKGREQYEWRKKEQMTF